MWGEGEDKNFRYCRTYVAEEEEMTSVLMGKVLVMYVYQRPGLSDEWINIKIFIIFRTYSQYFWFLIVIFICTLPICTVTWCVTREYLSESLDILGITWLTSIPLVTANFQFWSSIPNAYQILQSTEALIYMIALSVSIMLACWTVLDTRCATHSPEILSGELWLSGRYLSEEQKLLGGDRIMLVTVLQLLVSWSCWSTDWGTAESSHGGHGGTQLTLGRQQKLSALFQQDVVKQRWWEHISAFWGLSWPEDSSCSLAGV